MNTKLEPYKIHVAEDVLQDLEARLRATRWAPDLGNKNQSYGVSTAYLQELVDYWLNDFDWRLTETELNAYNQHRIEINGQPVHFIYEKGKGAKPTPIILSHGWPWTYWHWSKLIKPLTDPVSFGGDSNQSFDVIIPSLPGFGFSTPVKDSEMNFWKMADIFHHLMTKTLGYEKYAASGADYGGLVTAQLGHKYAAELIGVHFGQELPLTIFQGERPWDLTGGQMVPDGVSEPLRREIINFQHTFASHVAVHMLEPQTLTHGLNDSPAGMLAWILTRWKKWSDKNGNFEEVFPKKQIILSAMIYWVNQAIGSSIRVYSNANRYPWQPSHNRQPTVEAPAGFTFLVGEKYPPGATLENRVNNFKNGPLASEFNIIYAKAFEKGGHFGPWENPEAYIESIRDIFKTST